MPASVSTEDMPEPAIMAMVTAAAAMAATAVIAATTEAEVGAGDSVLVSAGASAIHTIGAIPTATAMATPITVTHMAITHTATAIAFLPATMMIRLTTPS